jgi:FHS family L-fucose permease-like MFS transporter
MRFLNPSKLLGSYAVMNVVLVATGVLLPGWFGLWALFLTSFFMSVMFPTIFALGLKELGPNTKIGGSFLVMAIVGGAVLTPIMGLISEKHGIASAYLVPLAAYLCVAIYSFAGAKARVRSSLA